MHAIIVLKCYYDQIFIFDLLGLFHSIPGKIKNVVYPLEISALVPEIFKLEKCVKYASERTNDIIHSTQYNMKYINRAISVRCSRDH